MKFYEISNSLFVSEVELAAILIKLWRDQVKVFLNMLLPRRLLHINIIEMQYANWKKCPTFLPFFNLTFEASEINFRIILISESNVNVNQLKNGLQQKKQTVEGSCYKNTVNYLFRTETLTNNIYTFFFVIGETWDLVKQRSLVHVRGINTLHHHQPNLWCCIFSRKTVLITRNRISTKGYRIQNEWFTVLRSRY